MISIALADLDKDSAVVATLVSNYLRQTEIEKAERGLAAYVEGTPLPPRYENEIERPAEAFRDCLVFVATDGSDPAGIVVVKPGDSGAEIKRLWVEPSQRGKSVASLLIDRATDASQSDVFRLTVWQWRRPALALYEKLGFHRVESWEHRPELVCLELSR